MITDPIQRNFALIYWDSSAELFRLFAVEAHTYGAPTASRLAKRARQASLVDAALFLLIDVIGRRASVDAAVRSLRRPRNAYPSGWLNYDGFRLIRIDV